MVYESLSRNYTSSLTVKLAPQVIPMTKPVADSRTLVYPVLAFVRVPVLIGVVQSE
jgi:hypothetical protein